MSQKTFALFSGLTIKKGDFVLKKSVSVLLILTLLCASCASNRVINGVEYDTRGIFHYITGEVNHQIKYEIVWGNVIWGAIFFPTVIAPVYFWGFSCMEPIREKSPNEAVGQVA